MQLLASIPSPSRGVIDIGPLQVHLYGVMLLLAIVAGAAVTGLRWRRHGGEWDLVIRACVWGVAGGIVGARLYHVITSWNEVPDVWWGAFAVWKGGLGVWGGVLGGVLAGAVVVYRAGASCRLMLDCLAPGLLVAQAVGRLGNWFNQELYGKPTDLPWGLEIDRPVGAYLPGTTFHPTFLYEIVWNLAGAAILILIGSRLRIRPPALFSLYVAWYTFGRFFEELLRVDPAHELAGLRINAWVSIVLFVGSVCFFVWWQFVRGDDGTGNPRVPRRRKPAPKRPAMAVPKGRVRRPR